MQRIFNLKLMKTSMKRYFRFVFFAAFFAVGCKKHSSEKIAEPIQSTSKLSDISLQKSKHLLSTSPQKYAVSLQMTEEEYQSWKKNDDYNNDGKRKNLMKDIYTHFQDKFDFIFLILNEKKHPDDLSKGQFCIVSNNITGIVNGGADQSIVNFCQEYGSSGKLQGIIALNQIDFLTQGPSLHEIMHRYGNYIFDKSEIFPGTKRIQTNGYHWGIMGGNISGQLGGFRESSLKKLGNKRYQVKPFGAVVNNDEKNKAPYSDFELYLMGMIPLNKVAPFSLFGGDITDVDGDENGNRISKFSATSRTIYNPKKIKQEFGERNPSSLNSQKKFRALVVVLTPRPLTAAEWKIVDDSSRSFGLNEDDGNPNNYNFWEATKGIGYMYTGNVHDAIIH